jgi:hypothetical protein
VEAVNADGAILTSAIQMPQLDSGDLGLLDEEILIKRLKEK